jgi:glycosyltransferase involved in cell wall biosynthesis
VVARPEPENSILEVVQGFSMRQRGKTLVVLGNYDPLNAYHRAVQGAAGPEVRFVGAIYDKPVVQALRFHSAAYVHGHQVGGTNPSLVEALGAGNAVLAHDNRFNRWVAADGAAYFTSAAGFDEALSTVLGQPDRLPALRTAALQRFRDGLTWPQILGQYEALLARWLPQG